jgi:molybdopterin-containing oxidoreductase family iron-sulfur binding subunit
MAIDTKRCFGCNACAVSCKSANGLPNNIWYNKVATVGGDYDDVPAGVFPDLSLSFEPVACQNCLVPACVAVCPTGASYRDAESGLVVIDKEVCIGCQTCMPACPYDARSFIDGEPVYPLDFITGYYDAPAHVSNTVEKCTFCYDTRVNKGLEPACMVLCSGRARFWGDMDDSESEIAQMVKEREYYRLHEDAGTEPSVYYLK